MIIAGQEDVTKAVLAAVSGAPDPRLREIMAALVRHLHGFVREVKLTEPEFQEACAFMARLGQHTTATHNEVVLMAGSLGVSPLVCLLNNGDNGRTETAANMLGPFWRLNSPRTENGGTLVRSPTPGPALFVDAIVMDNHGAPIAGAEVDVWHSSPEGFYENQDEAQADMNLRGKFTTGADGRFGFRSVKPAGYPIPVDGPVGEVVRALRRPHNFRPAHLHFLIYKPGLKTLISQIYVSGDPYLETDVQFGVTKALIGDFVRHDGPAPAPDVEGEWYSLNYIFKMEPGEAKLPRAPIS
jgi:catechol 1,2-dioxygenase